MKVYLKKETDAVRKRLINRTIRDVKCYHSLSGDCHIWIETDKGQVTIGANDLGVWIASKKEMRNGQV